MSSIFVKKDHVISAFIVPWILGIGKKTPQEATLYIKKGKELNPLYYPSNLNDIEQHGEKHVKDKFMNQLFNINNIDTELSEIVGENAFVPWDCLSGIFQYFINNHLGIVAKPCGVTKDNETIIMCDDFVRFKSSSTDLECKTKLLATMAVWKAKKGIYYFKQLDENISIEFDEIKWLETVKIIDTWYMNFINPDTYL